MGDGIELRAIEEVPPGSPVWDYDELPEPAKERFPAIAAGETDGIESGVAASLEGSIVRFTEYYEVS